jgi:hypothetical protein
VTTLGDLINDVLLAVEGWGMNQGRAAFLSGSMTNVATSFTVANADNLSEGVAEIDDELVYIQSVSGTTVTISADGRGYRGTTAASHSSGARVTMNPLVPRAVVKQKINDTIAGVYPALRGKATTTFTYLGTAATYELPALAEDVIQVTYDAPGVTGQWPKLYGWKLDTNANVTEYDTGKTLTLLQVIDVGRTVQVVYTTKPTALSSTSDNLTASGLADTARACIVAGAVWRLASFVGAAMLRQDSVAMDVVDDQSRQDPARVAAYLRAQYELELAEERRRQDFNQPPTMSFAG